MEINFVDLPFELQYEVCDWLDEVSYAMVALVNKRLYEKFVGMILSWKLLVKDILFYNYESILREIYTHTNTRVQVLEVHVPTVSLSLLNSMYNPQNFWSHQSEDWLFRCIQGGRLDIFKWTIQHCPNLRVSYSVMYRLGLRGYSDIIEQLSEANYNTACASCLVGCLRAGRTVLFQTLSTKWNTITIEGDPRLSPDQIEKVSRLVNQFGHEEAIPRYEWEIITDSKTSDDEYIPRTRYVRIHHPQMFYDNLERDIIPRARIYARYLESRESSSRRVTPGPSDAIYQRCYQDFLTIVIQAISDGDMKLLKWLTQTQQDAQQILPLRQLVVESFSFGREEVIKWLFATVPACLSFVQRNDWLGVESLKRSLNNRVNSYINNLLESVAPDTLLPLPNQFRSSRPVQDENDDQEDEQEAEQDDPQSEPEGYDFDPD